MTTAQHELRDHLVDHARALEGVRDHVGEIDAWGRDLARALATGGRLLVAGNGGSAAHAQHLTSELVGRFRADRPPYSAIALHADTSAVTAIVNDYGADAVFARQVQAHGRAGDVLLLISTSGRSANLLEAARAARECGVQTWALTGCRPSPLEQVVQRTVACRAANPATAQEMHQLVVHLLCMACESALSSSIDVRLGSEAERVLLP